MYDQFEYIKLTPILVLYIIKIQSQNTTAIYIYSYMLFLWVIMDRGSLLQHDDDTGNDNRLCVLVQLSVLLSS